MQDALFKNKDIFGIYSLLHKNLYSMTMMREGLDELKDRGN
jgi:hypothetical protein